jgi:hypothetical protein
LAAALSLIGRVVPIGLARLGVISDLLSQPLWLATSPRRC